MTTRSKQETWPPVSGDLCKVLFPSSIRIYTSDEMFYGTTEPMRAGDTVALVVASVDDPVIGRACLIVTAGNVGWLEVGYLVTL